MRALEDWADLKYRQDHPVAHVVPFGSPYSLCDTEETNTNADWFGTGCFDEIETAQALPRCTVCAIRVGASTTYPKEIQ